MQSHFSAAPPSGDPYEHDLTTMLGIALTRLRAARQEASAYLDTCAAVLATLPEDCRAQLQAVGRADAWGASVELLRAALAAKRREQ